MLDRTIDHPLELCVARVWGGAKKTINGSAFLVANNLVCTCTHVLQGDRRAPQKNVWINFPFLSETSVKATLIRSLAVERIGGDISFLSIAGAPSDALPLRLVPTVRSAGTQCETYGFPSGFERGIAASAIVGSRNGLGWRDLTSLTAHGVNVDAGFSGAPVWDMVQQGILGMIVAKHRTQLVSFFIPAEALAEASPEPLQVVRPSDTAFDHRLSELFVRGARRLSNPDPVADYLDSILRGRERGIERQWVYLTLGRLGGARARQVLRSWSRQERDIVALDGLHDAWAMIGPD